MWIRRWCTIILSAMSFCMHGVQMIITARVGPPEWCNVHRSYDSECTSLSRPARYQVCTRTPRKAARTETVDKYQSLLFYTSLLLFLSRRIRMHFESSTGWRYDLDSPYVALCTRVETKLWNQLCDWTWPHLLALCLSAATLASHLLYVFLWTHRYCHFCTLALLHHLSLSLMQLTPRLPLITRVRVYYISRDLHVSGHKRKSQRAQRYMA